MPHMQQMMNANPHMMMAFPNVLRTVQDCEATCEHMVSMLLAYPDVQARTMQIQFLRDSPEICATMAAFIARRSAFAKSAANLCAYICEVCGKECAKFSDQESQRCSRICLNCAQECHAFAMAG